MEAGKNIEITLSEISSYADGEGKITLYAIWNPKSYTVTYNTLGNGENILDVVTNTAEYGEAMSYTVRTQAAESVYDYYTFQGWGQYSTSTSYIDGSTISLSGDKTVYAVWKLGTIGESTGRTISAGSYINIPFTLLKTKAYQLQCHQMTQITTCKCGLSTAKTMSISKQMKHSLTKQQCPRLLVHTRFQQARLIQAAHIIISLKTRHCLKHTQSLTQ